MIMFDTINHLFPLFMYEFMILDVRLVFLGLASVKIGLYPALLFARAHA